MCGFVAVISRSPDTSPTEQMLRRMTDSIAHRGPDAEGVRLFRTQDASVGLGHRRLSIIDLGGGAQPMSNEDGSVWIVYNGEIYNYLALRTELMSMGHQFRTRCDTETIVHAYETWGPDCVDRLQGMFAFVIWDGRTNTVFAARDRMGIKPFYYVASKDSLLCASEAKALLASGLHSAQLNEAALPEFVTFGYVAGTDTLLRGVKKLPPGHRLQWCAGRLTTEQYWDIPHATSSDAGATEEDLVQEFLSLFRDSVRSHLMSDVPLGVFLSGGLDSSAIATTMAQEMSMPVKTFSVGFESNYYSEFDFAREVAASIGAEHHEVVLTPDRAFRLLPQLVWHEDEPIRFPAAVPLYEVSKLAREHVRVVLTGEGNDELFAGYERYAATLYNLGWGSWYHRVVPSRMHERFIRNTLWQWPLPLRVKTKLSHTFLNHSSQPEELIFDNWYAIFPARVHSQLFSPDMCDALREHGSYDETMRFFRTRGRNGDTLDQLLYTDQKTYLVELLQKQDKMSMAASIESRVPYLDHQLVEFAARVPARFKLKGLSGKYLVKRAMRPVLPESIVKRKKMGFPMPLQQWFCGGGANVVHNALTSTRSKDRGIFNADFITRILSEHTAGVRNHMEALWILLNFEVWARVFLDGDDREAIADDLASSHTGAALSTR